MTGHLDPPSRDPPTPTALTRRGSSARPRRSDGKWHVPTVYRRGAYVADTKSANRRADQSPMSTAPYLIGSVIVALGLSATTVTGSLALPRYRGELLGYATAFPRR
jgi:hypothetical protein